MVADRRGAPSARHEALLMSLSCHRLLDKVADFVFEGFPAMAADSETTGHLFRFKSGHFI